MLKVQDRVYHKGVRCNGVITEIDETKVRDKYKVEFFWGKYCTRILHGEWDGRRSTKWQWCDEDSLVVIPNWGDGLNMISMIGQRSLDKLIRLVCEIDARQVHDNSDVVIIYGQSNHHLVDAPFVINKNIIINKKAQMDTLGEDLAIQSQVARPTQDGGWIIKPQVSMGGRDIRPYTDRAWYNDYADWNEYYQRKFNKIREFRVHCFLWMAQPVQMIMEKFVDDTSQLCWNRKQGAKWEFFYQDGLNVQELRYGVPFDQDLYDDIEIRSVEALKKLNYDFGGIDFGMDSLGNLKIFEVNSRMGLKEQSLFTYKRCFDELRRTNIDEYKAERWS